jgi:8-amino-7-oxononanoate synthase
VLDEELRRALADLEARGLKRALEPADAAAGSIDLRSNDYLSLSRHPAVLAAASAALQAEGAGARGSRLLGGHLESHARAEAAAAAWLGAEAALLFPTAYQANLGLVGALAGRGDVLHCDELVHASLVDAARTSRARVAIFRHGDLAQLERMLSACKPARGRQLVLVESIYSMDGDLADLAGLHEVCARHAAWLVVDEAHACGLLGPRGAGAWSAAGLPSDGSSRLAARVVAGGKALGASGAFVVGSRALVDTLVQRARAFVYTTGAAPASAGALAEAIARAQSLSSERARVLALARELALRLALPAPGASIVPVPVGDAAATMRLREALARQGFTVGAARPPTVAPESSRLRVALHAHNTSADVERFAAALRALLPSVGVAAAQRTQPSSNAPRARVLSVVGTDTNVGKTVVAALLAAALRRRGPLCYWKPVQTGADSDTRTVEQLAGLAPAECAVPLYEFALPASPHTAAAAQGARIELERILARAAELRTELPAAQRPGSTGATLLVELAGGLLVPLSDAATQADLLVRLGGELVLVARSGLGTLNHTLLTLEALRARGLEPLALFLVGARHEPNRATLARLGRVARIVEVEPLEPLDAHSVAAWVDAHPLDDLCAP